jgi:hypothetical protein
MSPEARERSFDELASGLANGSLSRGRALKLMGAALVGGVLASIPGIAEAAPKPKPPGKKCKRDSQCSTQVCVSGVCGGTFACRRCPEDCTCAVRADGSIACIGCRPGELCQSRLVDSCDECVAPNVCLRPFGALITCAPPCTTLG